MTGSYWRKIIWRLFVPFQIFPLVGISLVPIFKPFQLIDVIKFTEKIAKGIIKETYDARNLPVVVLTLACGMN
jgi:hypothetical protein